MTSVWIKLNKCPLRINAYGHIHYCPKHNPCAQAQGLRKENDENISRDSDSILCLGFVGGLSQRNHTRNWFRHLRTRKQYAEVNRRISKEE